MSAVPMSERDERIAAYRAALEAAERAIAVAWPYVYGLTSDPNVSPWRRETARASLATMRTARDRVSAELDTVTP